ncbi:uncharacterized protein LOC106652159 [Trichogramma pretiosum]|uniref:uncharacterized protein LOC106652159 n=1 Tax=Trichogramma pretiosum TaxID=7493 RepID=UPI000C71C224|nr:uncharacterized protein LOC106652159 [Trichogramma pretiosum]
MTVKNKNVSVLMIAAICCCCSCSLLANAEMHQRKPRFISFNKNSGKVDLALDLSVPFLSIPLDNRNGQSGLSMPLVNINTKSLAALGILMALSAFVLPLLIKQTTGVDMHNGKPAGLHHQYRSDRALEENSWSSMISESLNDIFQRDATATPCMQRIACSAVHSSKKSDDPSNLDTIIEEVSSHRLFDNMTGASMKNAVDKGRTVSSLDECANFFQGCNIDSQDIASLFKIFNI